MLPETRRSDLASSRVNREVGIPSSWGAVWTPPGGVFPRQELLCASHVLILAFCGGKHQCSSMSVIMYTYSLSHICVLS